MIFTINSLGLFSEKSCNWERSMAENAKKWDKCFSNDTIRGISLHGTGCINILKLYSHLESDGLVINSVDLPEILSWNKCLMLILQDTKKGKVSLKQLKRRVGYKVLNVSNEFELINKINQLVGIENIKYLRSKSDSLINISERRIIEGILEKRTDMLLCVEIDEHMHEYLSDYIYILEVVEDKYPGRVCISFDTGHFYNFAKKMNVSLFQLIKDLTGFNYKIAIIELNQIGKRDGDGWHRIPWEKDAKIDMLETINQLKESSLLLDSEKLEVVVEIYPWFFNELLVGMNSYSNKIIEILKKI